MARTAGDIVTETVVQLHGWGQSQDRVTALASAMTITDTQFVVTDTFGQAVGITPGVVEIGSELVYVKTTDAASGVCTLIDNGRGWAGSTAVAHPAATAVTSRPKYPRVRVFQQVNEVLGSLYPALFATSTASFTAAARVNTYQLGEDARTVLDVSWQDTTGDWIRVHRWRKDPFDNALRVGDFITAGRKLRVIYAAEPGLFTSESNDFANTTGLPLTSVDLLTLGAVARLIPAADITRVQQTSVEQSDRSRVVPPNAGLNIASYLQKQFDGRLANESQSLRQRYPARLVKGF